MSLPSLTALRAFEVVARLGSMRAAADELGITASAISHQIHSLEAQMQVRLFVRRGRSISLTSAGQQYAMVVKEAFDRLRAATTALSAAHEAMRILTLPTFASEILLPALDEFEKRHPKLNLRVEVRTTLADVQRDPVDLAITYRPKPAAGAFSQALLKPVSSPVASPVKAALRVGSTPLDAILRQTIILHDPAPDAWLVWARAAGLDSGWKPRKTLVFDSFPGAVRAAIDGQGLLLAPLQMVAGHVREGRLRRLSDVTIPSLGTYYLECRQGEETLDRIMTVRRWLARVIEPHRHAPVNR